MTDATTVTEGTSQVKDNAARLGLTWEMRPATVQTADPCTVIVDGDVSPIAATPLTGGVAPGMRVMTMAVPPSALYITGFYGPFGIGNSDTSANANPGVQTRNVGTFGNLGTVSATFVKVASGTRIAYSFFASGFSDAAQTAVEYAINIGSTDYVTAFFFYNPANTHHTAANTGHIAAGLAAGTYTVQARWRRAIGAGTLNTDANDRVSMRLQEVV